VLAQGQPAAAAGGTNVTVNSQVTMSPQTFQLLVVLRNDLERALPVLRALNGNTGVRLNPAATGTGTVPAVTNRLNTVPSMPTIATNLPSTPTIPQRSP
jgi:hypothetical protein